MKRRFLFSVLGAAAFAAALAIASPALAAPRIYVRIPPPPVVIETAPVAPSPRHVWIGGYHRWDGRTYVWVPGRYVLAPRSRAVWVPGHWVRHHRGWYWREGHWRHR